MKITKENTEIFEFTEALYRKYVSETAKVTNIPPISRGAFSEYLRERLDGLELLTAGRGGAILYSYDPEERFCSVPAFGYFYDSEKTLSYLFERLFELCVGDGRCDFSVNLYAGDHTAIRLCAFMQFGIVCSTCIGRIEPTGISGKFGLETLSGSGIAENWNRIWELTHGIVRHLQKSPVFYPGEEFTEDAYREFFIDENTSLHAARGSDGGIVGIIETNAEEAALYFPAGKSVNVGEVFVVPELRGSGLAADLLKYAGSFAYGNGAEYMWVTHGTANPNARGFWDKYFTAVQYEMTRSITAISGDD